MLSNQLKADFAYAIPVLASKDVKQSVRFFEDLGGERGFITEDSRYGGVLFGTAELHFYLTAESLLLENSICRVQMRAVDALYEHCLGMGVVHPNGHIENKAYGYREFSILDHSGVCYTFAEYLGPRV